MGPESGNGNNQVLESHTKAEAEAGAGAGAGNNAALELDPEAKHGNHGQEQDMDPTGLELRLVPKDNESPSPLSLTPHAVVDQSQQWSMVSVSPRSGGEDFSEFTPTSTGWNMFDSSPMKPPSVQTMGSPAGYDPDRIPSSIFSSKPNEWSVASNESLFSIQMEAKPEDWGVSPLHVNYVSNLKSANSINFTSDLPPVCESENDKRKVDNYLPDQDFHVPAKENLPEVSLEYDNKEKVGGGAHKGRMSVSATSSNLSETRTLSSTEGARESAGSFGSFAFPLLVENGRSARSSSPGTMSAKQDKEEQPIQETKDEEAQGSPKPGRCNWIWTITGKQHKEEQHKEEQHKEEQPVQQTKDEEEQGPPKPGRCNWFSCTMCWRPGCCSMPKML